MADWSTPRTPDLQVRVSSLARRVVSLDKELYSTLSLSAQLVGPLGRVRLNLFLFHLYKVAESKDIEILLLNIVHRFKSFISFTLFDLI